MDDALYLSELCSKVYLIHRRNEFRGLAKTLERIRQKENIEVITPAEAVKIAGEGKVSLLELQDGRTLKVDGVFVAIGMTPQTDKIKDIVNLDDAGYVIADETGKTSAQGFFVAGDVRTKFLRQVITAASDGANAAFAAVEYLNHK